MRGRLFSLLTAGLAAPPAALRGHHLHQRLLTLSSATPDRQDHSPLVWRFGGGLDDLPVVLPICTPPRIPLRALADPTGLSKGADADPCLASRDQHCCAADRVQRHLAEGCVETFGLRRPNISHPRPLGSHGWPALLPAFEHQPAAASVAVADAQRRDALPAFCSLQRRLHAGFAELSRDCGTIPLDCSSVAWSAMVNWRD